MLPEIGIYIKDTYTEEKADIFVECFKVFDKYEIEDNDLQFVELLMESDYKDPYQAQLEFELLVKNNLMNICYAQGVELNDSAELNLICEIANSIYLIQNYEDSTAVLDTIGIDFTNEETFCELLQLVSVVSVDRLITQIDKVHEGIFVKLRELHSKVITEQIDQELTNEIINRLKIIKTYLNSDEYIGFKLIKRSASLGLLFEHYFLYLKMKIENLDAESAAKELFVLFTMSRDTYNSVIEEFSKRSSLIFTDIDKISKVSTALVKIVSDFNILYNAFISQQLKDKNAKE